MAIHDVVEGFLTFSFSMSSRACHSPQFSSRLPVRIRPKISAFIIIVQMTILVAYIRRGHIFGGLLLKGILCLNMNIYSTSIFIQ